MTETVLKTKRLILRKIEPADTGDIGRILQDENVMYAWEHPFTEEQVDNWIKENIVRYERDGYSYWAVVEKKTGSLVGVCGLIVEQAEGENYVGIGYIFSKEHWGRGYAAESAAGCMDYAFRVLQLDEVTAQIRPDNRSSRKVAEKLGMTVQKRFLRNYRGKDVPHLLYCRKKRTDFAPVKYREKEGLKDEYASP